MSIRLEADEESTRANKSTRIPKLRPNKTDEDPLPCVVLGKAVDKVLLTKDHWRAFLYKHGVCVV
jgi:hypothetical protein